MATYETPSAWEAAQGASAVTAIAFDGTVAAGTPSSVADAATIDAGLCTGWKVQSPSGRLTSLVDDGTKQSMVCASGGGGISTANSMLTNAMLYWPQSLIGDFDLQAFVASPAGDGTREIALAAYSGDTAGAVGGVAMEWGNGNPTTGQLRAYSVAITANVTAGVTTALLATPLWLRLQRVADDIIYSTGGTAAAPVWAAYQTKKWDRAGSAPRAGLIFKPGISGEQMDIYRLILNGYEYSAVL